MKTGQEEHQVSGTETRLAARSKPASAREGAGAGIPSEAKDCGGALLLLTLEIRWEETALVSRRQGTRTVVASRSVPVISSTSWMKGYGVPE